MTAISLTPSQARRLFIASQRLADDRPQPDAARILDVARSLGCLQLDPISVVARSHQLVLFSRLGAYDRAALDHVLWDERALFEYWAHCASIVLTEDYPIHNARMRAKPRASTLKWVLDNQPLRRHILRLLKQRGPVLARDIEESGVEPRAWVSTGWTSGRNTSMMLDYLWVRGEIMVVGRQGLQKVWDLAGRFLPAWTPRERLSEQEATRRAIEKSLKALGAGTARHIRAHFVRNRYPHFADALRDLEKAGRLQAATVKGWPGEWFVHADHAAQLEALAAHDQPGRAVLLSPFDNLICDRARTLQMFGFDFRIEIYVPAAKRRYGYYVLPILYGERLIGRLDPQFNRATQQLTVNAVHAEPGAPREAGPAVAGAVKELARFLGAAEIRYNLKQAPAAWRRALAAQ